MSSPAPAALELQADSIPASLKELPQWIVWRFEPRRKKDGTLDWTKVPYDAKQALRSRNRAAKSTDPDTWATYDDAVKAYELYQTRQHRLHGIGFNLERDGGLCCIDLDDALADGQATEAAQRVLAMLKPTYTEVSPSGTGLHVWLYGKKPGGRSRRALEGIEVEIYDGTNGRYLTVTGHQHGDTASITADQDGLNRVYELIDPPRPDKPRSTRQGSKPAGSSDQVERRWQAMLRSENGPKIQQLLEGELLHYDSESEATGALVHHLRFWLDDPLEVDRAFRASGLMRDKWDEKRGDSTWGQNEIDNAFSKPGAYELRPSLEHALAGDANDASEVTFEEALERAKSATFEDVPRVFIAMMSLPDSFTRSTQQDAILKALAKSTGTSLTALRQDFARSLRDGDDEPDRQPTQAEQLLAMFEAQGNEVWHDKDQEAMVTLTFDTHREHHRMRGKHFRLYLQRLWHEETEGGAIGREPLSEALGVLEGQAMHDGEQYDTFIRVAETGDTPDNIRIYLDLGTPTWEAVEIMAGKWHIVPASAVPVKFLRGPGMLPLPTPEAGTLDDVAAALGLEQDTQAFQNAVALLLQALRAHGPFPVGVVSGGQGAGKSTFTKRLAGLLDPNSAPLRSMARDEADLIRTARYSWIQAKDNISSLSPAISDALCRLATGGGISTRRLYTDDEELIHDAKRPTILNGITNFVDRQDLVDRALSIPLQRLTDTEVRTEADLDAEYEALRPKALAALLDIVSDGLKHAGQRHLARMPRMADFAEWITCCAPAMGLDIEAFLDAYDSGKTDLLRESLDESPVTAPLLHLMRTHDADEWQGSTEELLKELNNIREERTGRRVPKGWPQSAKRLANEIRRIEHGLAVVEGIQAKLTRSSSARYWLLRKIGAEASQVSQRRWLAEKPRPAQPKPSDTSAEEKRHARVTKRHPTPESDTSVTRDDTTVTHEASPKNTVSDGINDTSDAYDASNPPVRRDGDTANFNEDGVLEL